MFVFSFQLSPFSFQLSTVNFSVFISPICISRASACALTQNRLQRYNKIPTYANLTAFFLRFVCFFVHFPFFPSFPFPIPPIPRPSPSPFPFPIPRVHSHSPLPFPSLSIPRPSPFPASLPQYGGWPLFIYAWDVIPRSFSSHSHSPLPFPFPPSLHQYGGWPLFIYAWDVIPRSFSLPSPSPALLPPPSSRSHPCIPPIPSPVLSIPSFFFYAGYYPASLPCGGGSGWGYLFVRSICSLFVC